MSVKKERKKETSENAFPLSSDKISTEASQPAHCTDSWVVIEMKNVTRTSGFAI